MHLFLFLGFHDYKCNCENVRIRLCFNGLLEHCFSSYLLLLNNWQKNGLNGNIVERHIITSRYLTLERAKSVTENIKTPRITAGIVIGAVNSTQRRV